MSESLLLCCCLSVGHPTYVKGVVLGGQSRRIDHPRTPRPEEGLTGVKEPHYGSEGSYI